MVTFPDRPFAFRAASIPLLLSLPHEGTEIPPSIAVTMTAAGKSTWDTDWFLDRLYDFEELSDAGRIAGRFSRYVIDLNRSKDGDSLYPQQNTTGLIPRITFDQRRIYLTGKEPDEPELRRRIRDIWQPYHDCLQAELVRMRDEFGCAVLLEGHSIASYVPFLFEGTLPDLNLGTNHGQSCAASLADGIRWCLDSFEDFSSVMDGRFVGGYITRCYGNPAAGIHAIQLELSQATHLVEETKQWAPEKVTLIQPVLRSILRVILQWINRQ